MMRIRTLFILSCLVGLSAAVLAEEVDRPPEDPQPVPAVDLRKSSEDVEPPGVLFDATRNMKTRADKKAEEWGRQREEANARALAKIVAALDELRDYKLEIFMLDVESESTPEINRDAHNPVKGGVFYGWKIKDATVLDGEGSIAARKLVTQPEYYTYIGTNCFTPGMGLYWKDDKRTYSALVCLYCRAMRFVLTDSEIDVPLSASGRIAGTELFLKAFKDEQLATWLVSLQEQQAASVKKRIKKEAHEVKP